MLYPLDHGRLTSSSLSLSHEMHLLHLSHEMHLLLHLHHSRLVRSRKWVYLRCASPLLSRTHQVAGHSCSILRRAAAVRGCVLPLRMRGATAAALRVLPPKARGTGEFRLAVSAHAVQHCAARRCRSLLARASPSPRCLSALWARRTNYPKSILNTGTHLSLGIL